MILILLITVLLLLIYYWIIWYRSSSPIPCGPIPLPFIGNIHQLGKNPGVQFSKWATKYGKLYTVYFGTKPALVISDAALMKQFFNKSSCCGRPRSAVYDDLYLRGGVIYATSVKSWQEQRQFFVRSLQAFERNFGHEGIIQTEVVEFANWMDKTMTNDGRVYLFEQLKAFTSNIIWSLICGSRQETNIAKVMENWAKGINRVSSTGLFFFDFIGKMAPGWSGQTFFQKACKDLQSFVMKQFELERSNGCQSGNLISAYLKAIENTKDSDSPFYGENGYEEAVDSINSMLIAATETTAASINWLLFYLATHENIQTRVQEEEDEISGNIGLQHRSSMPYTQAFIEETLRLAVVLPFGLFHEVEEDFEWNGTKFKKGLQLVANIYHVNKSKEIWGDPDVLRPERFMETVGEKSPKEYIVSFQPGKRVCPGDSLARDVMFLTLTNLVKQYSFVMEETTSRQLYLEADQAFLSIPKHVPVCVKRRQ